MNFIWADYLLIRKSGLFDRDYYLNTYPDCKTANIDPLLHYLKIGWKEGRNPSKYFNTTFYLESNRDVRISRKNPLSHYIRHGKKEGRIISPNEISQEYLTKVTIDQQKNIKDSNFFNLFITQIIYYISMSFDFIKNYGFLEFLKKIKSKLSFTHIERPPKKGGNQNYSKNPYEIIYNELLSSAKSVKTDEYIEERNIDELIIDKKVKYIAFYLPQFHPIPENDLWWGKGFTEWTNVSKAIPQFLGHYQPRFPGELGYYDLRNIDTLRRQVDLAKKYGVFGFCFYYYWFNGKRLLEKPLENLINNQDINFPFCICWANEDWTKRWDGRSDQTLISQEHSFEYDSVIINDFIKYFNDSRYIKINGRPLIIVYRANILKDPLATISYWKEAAKTYGFCEPLVLATQTFGYTDPRKDGFDGVIEFPPHNINHLTELSSDLEILNPEYSGIVYRYSDLVKSSIQKLKKEEFKKFYTVFPSWDNEARRPGNGLTFTDSTPEWYGLWLNAVSRETIKSFKEEERFVFINAWNEWAEGAYLEPDRRYGYAYLQMTYDVLKNLDKPNFMIREKTSKIINTDNLSNKYQNFYNNFEKKWPQYTPSEGENNQILYANIVDNFFLNTEEIPDVSIIIPIFNHFSDTFNCLKSISQLNNDHSFEIIIVDDHSTDETNIILSLCKNIKYLRNEQNIGFLKSVNLGVNYAKGDYVVLLNNDTVVLSGWLDNLVKTFMKHPKVGLVGSKLIYPDGNLQEAGGIIWSDGSGQNFGRNDDPIKPEYNFLRNVDYCSGASICIPKKIWEEVGGFDETFSPAYYEDTDLAFRVREHGYEVLYQPFSEVIHLEGKTSGTDITKGIKRFQEINKEKFYGRWKSVITDFGSSSAHYLSFRNRLRNKNALVIDVCTPKPDQDSGSIDTYNYLLTLRKLGFEVTFISVVDPELIDKYVRDLQFAGIEVIYQPYLVSIDNYIKRFAKFYDLFLLFRAPFGGKYVKSIRKHAPKSKIIFNTVDLHFLREIRESEVSGRKSIFLKNLMKHREMNIMKKSDHTILVSEYEKEYLDSINPKIKTSVIPLPREIPGRKNGFIDRKHIVFIGGFLHKPNIDAVQYFIQEIWPYITEKLVDCEFWIVGSNIPGELKKFDGEKIKIVGFVEDLSEIFDNCKLSVAPLRYGAGVKGKILTSLSYGVPCVATSIATEGMRLTIDHNIIMNDNPKDFAESVNELYLNEKIWETISLNGLDFIANNFSLSVFEERFKSILHDLKF